MVVDFRWETITSISLSLENFLFLFLTGLNICLLAMEVATKAKAAPSFYAAASPAEFLAAV